uniref:EOG090X08JJ n=1 Tax=Daphnia dolichocephala TaxID=2282166 RepID=A0A4Y7M604_9CRUS|nr:EOG090X08JJ [Daphnia dolichocephala]
MSKLKILQPVEETQEFLDIDEGASDSGDDEQTHEKLLNAITKLGKNKKMNIAQRTEPVSRINEFALVDDLLDVLLEKPRFGVLQKAVKEAKGKTSTLKAPLEKPVALRVERAAGYEKVKDEISKWDDTVQGNRIAEQLIFPLNQPSIKMNSATEFTAKFKPKTRLEEQISKLLSGNKHVQAANEELTPAEEEALSSISLKEALERRKELAKSRALQSYQEAKARRQNKIKSKSYHRLLKREKMKNHIKEFDALKECDPEKALEKLEQLDKKRIEERMTLKHKGAGKWAKLQAIRSKYDQNARDSLADQLRLGKEVTRKVKKPDDESEDDMPAIPLEKSDNPWLGGSAPEASHQTTQITSGYRKLWDKVNEGKEIKKKMNEGTEIKKKMNEGKEIKKKMNEGKEIKKKMNEGKEIKKKMNEGKEIKKKMNEEVKKTNSQPKKIKKLSKANENRGDLATVDPDENDSVVSESHDMEEEFSEELVEGLVRKRTLEDYQQTTEDLEVKRSTRKRKNKKQPSEDHKATNQQNGTRTVTDIDPFKFLSTSQTVVINSSVPVFEEGNAEEDEEEQRRMTLAEAFADDDVIEQFNEEKNQAINASTPKDIDLTLPGWGEWGGSGLKISNRKKRQFIIKAPPVLKRKDENKGNLIINQDKSASMRRQQVNDLPFPFRSAIAFESSIRAPVTSTFIPETAVHKLAAPKVITKIGTVIEPMSADVLISTANRNKETEDNGDLGNTKKSSGYIDKKRKRPELAGRPVKKPNMRKNDWKITDKHAKKSFKKK